MIIALTVISLFLVVSLFQFYFTFEQNIDSLLCSSGCGKEENSIHLFFIFESIFCTLWRAIIKWLGVSCVLPNDAQSHAFQFCGS
jgi:hypothetical protein